MEISRRDFIRSAAKGLLGGFVLTSSAPFLFQKLAPLDQAPEAESYRYRWKEERWVYIVDTRKCIGCGRCVLACKLENNVPLEPEYNRTWVERYVVSEDGETFVDSPAGGIDGFAPERRNGQHQGLEIRKAFFVPKLCNQCDKPPCVRVCPVGATYMTTDGVTLVDKKLCIGCRYCIQACPYRARFLDPEEGVADKCTWCYHRITRGARPACVEACPVGARIFGDPRDPKSPVGEILRKERLYALKPPLGTVPKVYYLGLELEVQ